MLSKRQQNRLSLEATKKLNTKYSAKNYKNYTPPGSGLEQSRTITYLTLNAKYSAKTVRVTHLAGLVSSRATL
jgi:hypothetical protein